MMRSFVGKQFNMEHVIVAVESEFWTFCPFFFQLIVILLLQECWSEISAI